MPAGRPSSEDRAYAAELGLPLKAGSRKIGNLGGARKLKGLSEEALEVLLHPKGGKTPKSSLAKLGMVSRHPQYLIPPIAPAPLPLEALLTEEDLQIEVPDLE